MEKCKVPFVMRPFNHYAFHRRRKALKLTGLIVSLAGIFTMLDLVLNVRLPVSGSRAVFLGIVLIIFGVLFLYHGYKLPLEEALEIVHNRGQGITASELVHEMRVDRLSADRIIAALLRKGFLRSSANAGTAEEVFEPVQ